MSDAPHGEARESGGLTRPSSRGIGAGQLLLIGCGVAFLLGVVFVTLAALFLSPRMDVFPASGAQPGGPIEGRVVPLDAARAVGAVTLSRGEGNRSSELETTQLDQDGHFRFDAPPIDGYYIVSAGAGTWSSERRAVSMLTESGEAHTPPPVVLELTPACVLEVRVVRADPEATIEGDVRYRLDLADGPLFGLLAGKWNGSTGLIRGAATLDSLPPGKGSLTVTLDDGATRTAAFELSLDDPRVTLEFEL